jgi:hypothetical protein
MGSIGLGDSKELADLANQGDVSTTGGGAASAIFSKEQSDEIRRKAGAGRVIGMDDLNPRRYLGHFAGDSVAAEGHNTGAKPIGVVKGGEGVAKNGYRVIPGGHSEPVLTKKQRAERAQFEKEMSASMRRMNIKVGMPSEQKPEKAPLRKQAREAKRAAGPGKGPLRHT